MFSIQFCLRAYNLQKEAKKKIYDVNKEISELPLNSFYASGCFALLLIFQYFTIYFPARDGILKCEFDLTFSYIYRIFEYIAFSARTIYPAECPRKAIVKSRRCREVEGKLSRCCAMLRRFD